MEMVASGLVYEHRGNFQLRHIQHQDVNLGDERRCFTKSGHFNFRFNNILW